MYYSGVVVLVEDFWQISANFFMDLVMWYHQYTQSYILLNTMFQNIHWRKIRLSTNHSLPTNVFAYNGNNTSLFFCEHSK